MTVDGDTIVSASKLFQTLQRDTKTIPVTVGCWSQSGRVTKLPPRYIADNS